MSGPWFYPFSDDFGGETEYLPFRLQEQIVARWHEVPPTMPILGAKLPQGTRVRKPYVIWSIYNEYPQMYRNPKEWWPQLIPSAEYADFSYDATNDVDFEHGDYITGLSLSVAPNLEVIPSRLELSTAPLSGKEALITAWLTGGVPGRIYTYELIITTRTLRQLPIIIGQRCIQLLPMQPPPPPSYPNFGGTVTWTI